MLSVIIVSITKITAKVGFLNEIEFHHRAKKRFGLHGSFIELI